MNCGIYKITNIANGKIYIGSSIDLKRRKRQHLLELKRDAHENKYLQNNFNKYGEISFKFEDILYCIENNLLMYEQLIIDGLNSINRNVGYNLCPIAGRVSGRIYSEETKNKMSLARKGMKLSEEHKANIGKAGIGNKYNLGRILSEEEKKQRSNSMKLARAKCNWSTRKTVT